MGWFGCLLKSKSGGRSTPEGWFGHTFSFLIFFYNNLIYFRFHFLFFNNDKGNLFQGATTVFYSKIWGILGRKALKWSREANTTIFPSILTVLANEVAFL